MSKERKRTVFPPINGTKKMTDPSQPYSPGVEKAPTKDFRKELARQRLASQTAVALRLNARLALQQRVALPRSRVVFNLTVSVTGDRK